MKKCLSFFVVSLIVLVLTNCNKNNPSTLDVVVNFLVLNKSGKNLFDTTTVGHYNIADVRTFYIDENNKKVEFYYPNLNQPHGVGIEPKDDSIPTFAVFTPWLGRSSSTQTTTNFIQWREGDVDTVLAKIRKVGTSMFVDVVTVNGKDLYVEGVSPRIFTFNDPRGAYVTRLVTLRK